MTDSTPVILPDSFDPADYEHWARAKLWTEGEAVTLALGCEPFEGREGLEIIYRIARTGMQAEKEFLQRAVKMQRLVERHFGNPHFTVTIEPAKFLAWLRDLHLWIPNGMAEAIEQYDHVPIDWKARANQAEAKIEELVKRVSGLESAIADGAINTSSATRQRETLLKLFIGMAVEQYGYDPSKQRSTVARDIASDTETVGLSVSDDTVRTYLSEGAELLRLKTE